ncbi:LysM peptidoglycan-binding domain-containing protein [Mesorhizobium sp. WSM2239]|uniref:LysM peptidoglycan-binding domain-containing protein n=2 Tax=unclassified Mesorhizobium TaxID=325217 RepID=A0AAU8D4F7_9HYPH
MALTPIKALLFLAGGAAAAGGVAYVSGVFDPYLGGEAPKLAAAPVPGTSEANPKSSRLPQPPAANAPSAGTPAASAPAAGASTEGEVLPPSFDVVRVEGDGSIVIAGEAAAGATVEIVTGARVIGNAVAGPDGDFAVVIDEPLKPGGYQIVLRSTAPDNVVATSLETAVVSIPDKPDGQVLALVEKPGEPSKLITVPEPQPAPPLSGDAAAPEAPASAEAAPAAPEEKPASGGPEASASAEVEAPAEEAPPAEQPAAAQEPEPAPTEAAPDKPDEQVAAAKPDQEPVELTPSAPSGEPQVTVEAVEIEGRKVFVAGVADPGRKVRVYANDILLGDADASPSGRFLIETERDLPVGDYIIRADALEPDGVKVAARAAVPFEREEGENLAAVAPSVTPQAEAPATGADRSAAAAPDVAEPQSAPTAPTPNDPSAGANGRASAEAPIEPDATPSAAPSATAEASPPTASGTEASQPAVPTPPATAEADAPSTQPTEQSATAPAGTTTAPASESTPTTSAEAETAKPATGAEIAAAPEATRLAPKLESVPGAVIIRRGDSLWRISRRVYGKGVRYSTIYLANQEQISDPDRIWPGQVFKVPEKTSEGEEADMKAIGGQAVTTTTQ